MMHILGRVFFTRSALISFREMNDQRIGREKR